MRLTFLAILMIPSLAWASPFLVSDPDVTGAADKCVYQEGSSEPVATPLVQGACKIDLAQVSAGQHDLQVWFSSSLWGVDSAKVPFSYSRPAAGASGPSGLRISPQ